ncbi:hypothetical protein BGX38DRAFT_650755 [Terfezia claveryi]|nr:hypothetical protein BGX38DRAFT_650755 [Terfezia claveryi]
MNTSLTVQTRTPGSFGGRTWVPCLSTCSTGSSRSESAALSDITVSSQALSTLDDSQHSDHRTQAMVDMAEGLIRQTPKESEAVVIAVGSEKRIKEYVTKTRRDRKAGNRFRSLTIREIAILIFTYIGYESVPRLSNPGPDFDDYDLAGYFITIYLFNLPQPAQRNRTYRHPL